MDDKYNYILSLIKKFEDGELTEAEQEYLDEWFKSFESNPNISNNLSEDELKHIQTKILQQINLEIENKLLLDKKAKFRLKIIPLWKRISIAASFLFLLSVSGFLIWEQQHDAEKTIALRDIDFAPATNKAILTLENGEEILLDNAKSGEIIHNNQFVVTKSEEGTIRYNNINNAPSKAKNTLKTPKSATYNLTLADGTKAWLNAASSITYPTTFNSDIREVNITGEVYFEVAHNSKKPFRVKSGNNTIEVLGTHFNVNSYEINEGIKTTLLEGSVAIQNESKRKLIKPGEQAINIGNDIKIEQVDLNEVMAWKEGFFDFTDADIHTIMKEFSRWYDLEIIYEGPAIKETFTGRIPKSWTFSKVIDIMKTFKSLNITSKGRRIMIRP